MQQFPATALLVLGQALQSVSLSLIDYYHVVPTPPKPPSGLSFDPLSDPRVLDATRKSEEIYQEAVRVKDIKKQSVKNLLFTSFERLPDLLELLDLRLSLVESKRILKKMQDTNDVVERHEVDGLLSRIRDELEDVIHVQIAPIYKDFFSSGETTFGTQFQSNFPSCKPELSDACKCLALERYTAAVFHLMRIMEVGLRAISVALAIKNTSDRNWGSILKNVKAALDDKSRWQSNDDFNFYSQCYVSIDSVRQAWRNTTMHVENRYDEEEAKDVFNSVRAFMKKLASSLDENGTVV